MTSTALVDIRRQALDALYPPRRIVLSDWIETELRLPAGVSAEPGRVRLWAYQRGIADAISDPAVERVTFVKSVRTGLTTIIVGAVAGYVANDPGPVMLVLPTDDDCRNFVVSNLDPTFEASPAVAGLLSNEAGRDTMRVRHFPGGSLKIIASRAPRTLRAHTVQRLLLDEVDAMETTAEGNPIDLAIKRTLSFADRKIILGSTPTVESTSNVVRSYAQSDQRVFEVPCPECGAFTEIQWGHIEWEPDRPETAAFRCPNCEDLIPEIHKPAMVAAGVWRATAPEVIGHAGFRLNALVSCLANASWGRLAAEFLDAKDHPDKLQVFVNTILGQGWREEGDILDEDGLRARAESFSLQAIPADVLFVTAGVDVQHDRLEVTLLGHARDSVLVLAHAVIWGSPGEEQPWSDLDGTLRATWPHPNGGTLRVDAAIVDSGDGAWTERVYAYCRARFSRRVMAGKGVAGSRPPIQRSSLKTAPLFLIGVDDLKGNLIARLSRGSTVRFSDTLPPVWFEQLTSERRVLRYVRGQPVRRFERIPGRAAEALDCMIYAMAARHLLTVNPDRREAELATAAALPSQPKVIRSAWLSG